MPEVIYKDESYRVIGACFEVYNEKGCGFTEPVYQECLEVKAVSALTDEHRSQVLNYLNATGYKLGLLVNFGHHGKLEWERIVK